MLHHRHARVRRASRAERPRRSGSRFVWASRRSPCKGRRPTWEQAAPGPVAEPLVAAFADRLRSRGATVAQGQFGAMMRVEMTNDGPVTIIVEV